MPTIANLKYPDTERHRYSRTSVDLVASVDKSLLSIASIPLPGDDNGGTFRIYGWTNWTYEMNLKPGKAWDSSGRPTMRTRGELDLSMNLKLFVEDWVHFRTWLMKAATALGFGFMEVPFVLIGTLYEPDFGTTKWTGDRCRIQKVGGQAGDGDEPLQIDLELDVMDILQDDVSVLGGQASALATTITGGT